MVTDIPAGSIPLPMKRRYQILPLLAAALILSGGLLWWRYTIDDTYITLRYAENVALGNGPVFNPGERTEGYSCPLWALLLGLVRWMGGDPLFAAKALGLLSAFGLAGLLYSTLLRRQCDALLAGVVTVWLAALPGLHVYAGSGMETLPFALAVAALVAVPSLCPSPSTRAWAMPVSLLAVATLRPEGLLLFAATSVLWWRKEASRQVRLGIALAGIALLVLLLLRWQYYGSLLPNTYLAKPSPLLHAIRTAPRDMATLNLIYMSYADPLNALNRVGGTALLLSAILALALHRRGLDLLSAAAAVVVGGIFVWYVPTDWMPEYRFGLPFVFPLLFLAALGLDALRRLVPARDFRTIRIALLLTLGVWLVFNIGSTLGLWLRYSHRRVNPALNAAPYAEIGRWLAQHSAPEDRVLAFEIGAVGYYSRRNIVDHEGLITVDVAQVIHKAGGYSQVRSGLDPAAMNQIVDYCAAQRPDWFLVLSSTSLPLTPMRPVPKEAADEPIQQALLQRFGSSMVLRQVFPLTATEKYLLLQRTGRE